MTDNTGHVLPYPHLLTHPTRALTLVYTPEAEAEHLTQGYTLVHMDTRYVWLMFRRSMALPNICV